MKKGFTIVELVIVIAIISILAAVLIPSLANGVLTSNRLNNRFKIVDNKFTDEKVMTDKEVADYIDHLERIKAK